MRNLIKPRILKPMAVVGRCWGSGCVIFQGMFAFRKINHDWVCWFFMMVRVFWLTNQQPYEVDPKRAVNFFVTKIGVGSWDHYVKISGEIWYTSNVSPKNDVFSALCPAYISRGPTCLESSWTGEHFTGGSHRDLVIWCRVSVSPDEWM